MSPTYRTMEEALKGIWAPSPIDPDGHRAPGMDGVEGTHILRERFPEVPFSPVRLTTTTMFSTRSAQVRPATSWRTPRRRAC